MLPFFLRVFGCAETYCCFVPCGHSPGIVWAAHPLSDSLKMTGRLPRISEIGFQVLCSGRCLGGTLSVARSAKKRAYLPAEICIRHSRHVVAESPFLLPIFFFANFESALLCLPYDFNPLSSNSQRFNFATACKKNFVRLVIESSWGRCFCVWRTVYCVGKPYVNAVSSRLPS